MKFLTLFLSGCLMLGLFSCTPDQLVPVSAPLNSDEPVLASPLTGSVQEFSAQVVLSNSLASSGLSIPIPIYLFDLAEIGPAGSYDPESQALASAVGTEWAEVLPVGNYRFEVFEGEHVLPSGETVHWMPAHIDFFLTDSDPNQTDDLFVEAWID